MRHSVYPWLLLLFSMAFIYGLSYYATHRQPLRPSYQFYDSATVHVEIHGMEGEPLIYGQFNNILEGKRQLVTADSVESHVHRLRFHVNSPRPALLYVDDHPIQLMLVPQDSSLYVDIYYSEGSFEVDSLLFTGEPAVMCEYFLSKSKQLGGLGIRRNQRLVASDDFLTLVNRMDSLAAKELVFLVEQEIYATLPQWFVTFEKNDILYQRAYLKLSAAYNQKIPKDLLDRMTINNPGAVFSYYYYLYLNAYFQSLQPKEATSLPYAEQLKRNLALADSLLEGDVHDVFISRAIFQQLANNEVVLGEEIYQIYKDTFYSRKYIRYLARQILQKKQKL